MTRLYIDFYQEVSFEEKDLTVKNRESLMFEPKSFRSYRLNSFDPNYQWSSKKKNYFFCYLESVKGFISSLEKIGFLFSAIYYEKTTSLIKNRPATMNQFKPFEELIILLQEVTGGFSYNLFEKNKYNDVYRGDLDSDYSLKIYQDLQTFYPLIGEIDCANRDIYTDFLNCFELSAQKGLTVFSYYQDRQYV